MTTPRVIEYDGYGSAEVLMQRDAIRLGAPGACQLRIRIKAASINPKDVFVRKGRFRSITGDAFPRRTGYDFSGIVDEVGKEVADVAVGDCVYGMLNGWAGGVCADQVIAAVDEIAPMPAGSSPTEAAAIPLAALTALQALRDVGRVATSMSVCINGASGGVGLFAVQIARAIGAKVVAVASDANKRLCLEAGADAFVDYTSADPFACKSAQFDVIFDVFGNCSFAEAAPGLSEHGVYVSTVPSPQIMQDVSATSGTQGRRAGLVIVSSHRADLLTLADMTARGQLRPHLDAIYPMAEIADAHRHVERKHTKGKVVLSME